LIDIDITARSCSILVMCHKTLFTEPEVDHVPLLLLLNTWQASSERTLFWKVEFGEYEQQGIRVDWLLYFWVCRKGRQIFSMCLSKWNMVANTSSLLQVWCKQGEFWFPCS
jgi:hypothetical protein